MSSCCGDRPAAASAIGLTVTIGGLRVLVVSSFGAVGGAEHWLLDLLDATERLSVEAVSLSSGPLLTEFARRGIPTTVLPAGRTLLSLVGPVRRFTARLRASRPDVVVANGFKAGLVAGAAGRLAGVRVVWVKHDHSFDGVRTRLVASLCASVVATSPTLAAASGRADVVTVPPPRHTSPLLDRAAARAVLVGLGVPLDHRPVLAVVGRLVAYKGVEDAVRALALPDAGDWRLVLVGRDDDQTPGEQQRLTGIAMRLGVADRLHVVGYVPDVRTIYPAFDALGVLTQDVGSGPAREGFGITALEAMIAGVPVIAVGPGPVADRLEGQAGVTVPPGRPDLVAAALGRLSDSDHRAALGSAGRELAAGHPTAATCADHLVRHLATVARRPGAGLTGDRPVSVVATVLNEAEAVDDLVGALRKQLRLPDDEILIVDGGSTDATAERVLDHAVADPRVRLLSRPGAGISAGRNAGIADARSELVACTDAGCRPADGWLEALRSAAAESDGADLLTGVYRVAAAGPLQAAMAVVGYPEPEELRHPSALVDLYGRFLGRTFDPTMPTGRSMAFTREAWRRAGGFPEHLQTGEDVLFGRRIALFGRAVMVADAEVEWDQRDSMRATATMYWRYGAGSGLSRDRRLLARDLSRAAALLLAPVLLARGGAARATAVAGVSAYLSLPWRRALRRPDAALVALAVPVVAVVRDGAKAAGCLVALWSRR